MSCRLVRLLLVAACLSRLTYGAASLAFSADLQSASRPRVWTDSTGTRQARATLIEVRGDTIFLRKESGKLATSSFNRLSSADQAFVKAFERQAAAAKPPTEPFRNVLSSATGKAGSNAEILLDALVSKLPEVKIPGPDDPPSANGPASAEELPSRLMYLSVSRQFFEHYITPEVHETRPVQHVIVGTVFNGVASTTGRNTLQFIPRGNEADINLRFAGTSFSDSRGGDPVQIHSHATTVIQASKRVILSELGIKVLPTVTCAQSNTEAVEFCTALPGLRGRMAKRIAEHRTEQSHEQANEESAHRAEIATNRELDRRINRPLAALNEAWQRFFAIARENNLALKAEARTSASRMRLVVVRQTPGSPAIEELPQPIQGKPQVGIWIHASLIKRVLSDAQLQNALQPLLSKLLVRGGSAEKVVRLTDAPNYRLAWSDDGKWMTISVDFPRNPPTPDPFNRTASVGK